MYRMYIEYIYIGIYTSSANAHLLLPPTVVLANSIDSVDVCLRMLSHPLALRAALRRQRVGDVPKDHLIAANVLRDGCAALRFSICTFVVVKQVN